MSKLFNDATITEIDPLTITTYRKAVFNPTDGKIYYEQWTTYRGSDATKTITTPGLYSFTGTTSTWTLDNAIKGVVHMFNGGSGDVILSGAINANIYVVLGPGASLDLYWDGTEYVS